MSTIFSKIISGELSCYKIAEDADFLAFLDVNPNAEGHTLCIPKKEVNKIFDLDDDNYLKLMRFSKKIAVALEKTIDCKRVGMAVIGLEVPHAHVHLIPINAMDDMRFQNKVTLTKEQFETLAEKIKNNLN